MPDEAHSHEQAPRPAPAPQAAPAPPAQTSAGAGPLSVAPSAVGNKTFSAWTGGPGAAYGTPPPPAAGNGAMARWATGGGAPIARTPTAGNAPGTPPDTRQSDPSPALARSVLARDNGAGASAGPGGTNTSAPTGSPVPVNLFNFFQDTIVPKEGETSKDIKFPKKTYRVGGGTSGKKGFHPLNLHRAGAGLDWNLDAEAMATMEGGGGVKLKREKADGDNVRDTISGYGGIKFAAGAWGRLSAGIKADAIIAGVSAGVAAKLLIRNATGTANISGSLSRTGAPASIGEFSGGSIKYNVNIAATLSAAASAYFEWHFLWWGRRYEVKIGQFDIGTVKLGVEGEIGIGKPSTFPKITPELIIGTVPTPAVTNKGKAPDAPQGSVASRMRRAAGSGDDDPGSRPIGSRSDGTLILAGQGILARTGENQDQTPDQTGGTPPPGQQQDPNAPPAGDPSAEGAAPVEPGQMSQEPRVGGDQLDVEHQFEVQSEEGGGGA